MTARMLWMVYVDT